MPELPKIEPPSCTIPICCAQPSQGDRSLLPDAVSPSESSATQNRFHFSLNVSNIDRSVAFYSQLFNISPAKHHKDYAKFELSQPPLVFSLVPLQPASQGALSHLGFPVSQQQ
jgi:hypothetical protein